MSQYMRKGRMDGGSHKKMVDSHKNVVILFYTVDLQVDGVSIQRGYSQQQSCSTMSGNEMVKIEHSYLNKFMVRQV